jgi:ABC-type sugar transport system ATPase subunit
MELYRNPASRFVAEFIGAPPMNVYPLASPGGRALAQLAGGAPSGAHMAGVRPEALHIAREGPSGDVILVEALGAESLIHLRMGEDRMILRGGHDSRSVEGQTLHLGVDAEAITFFDADERAMDNARPALKVVD